MRTKQYHINIDNAVAAWDKFTKEIGEHVDGDMNKGVAKGMGFKVSYSVNGDELTINLLKKPFLAPESLFWNKLESNLEKYNIVS